MPKVFFDSIKCHETTSGAGDDTVAVWFRGEQMFGSEMKGGRHRNIHRRREFDSPEKVWVKEVDAGSDDLIGTFFVTSDQIGHGTQVQTMMGDGSHYDLFYVVEP
ncbi:hypothetical protein [Streptomyces europaeiscabiei]|uniref:hypothetical protein n=1 Tax=Streptomyces europaeiscabiei TaxID=146819 RepID=UPI002E2C4ADA|nr:hypothetical protein [Streptomyces europaeiscabiei]